MNKISHFSTPLILCIILVFAYNQDLFGQTFPSPSGFILPAGKTIVITYEVDVNANVCPTGTSPAATDISNQSNVSGTNFATVQTDDPDIVGPSNPTLTPFSTLTLGDLVYLDNNRNGIFDAGDFGINGVLLNLYADNGDNVLTPADGAPIATATTAGGGLYSFAVCPGSYIVEVAPSNFAMGGALHNGGAQLISSPVGGAPDPNDNVNNDDNGDPVVGFGVASSAISLDYGTEPTGNGNENLTLDFGFKSPTTVTINDVTMAEGTGGSTTAFTFTVSRNDDSEAFDLTVNTVDGSAVSTSDYSAIINGMLSFTAGGNLDETITVLVNHDNIVENNETFNVVLSGAPLDIIITDDTGLGTINNDDTAILTLSGGGSQNEGTDFTMTATLSAPVQGGFGVNYTTNNGTATTADNDYTDNDGNLNFAGTINETQSWIVSTISDDKVELDETFTGSLGTVSGTSAVQIAAISIVDSPQIATILNDDDATISIVSNISQLEANSPQTFSVELSNPVDVAVTVLFSTSDNTAMVSDNDYMALTNQTVTFPANSASTQTVPVTIISDNKVEADEIYDVTINGLNASGRDVLIGTSTATGTILNDDSSVITLSGGISQNEGNSGTTSFIFTATLSNPVQNGFTANYTTNDGTATLADNDYIDNDGTLVFTGNLAESHQITVLVNGDLDIEDDETFTVTLNSLSGIVNPPAVTIAGSPQTGTILNDELDWGDAPDSYSTTSASNGARHSLSPSGLKLGATVTADLDGQPSAAADADTDDGVTLPAFLITGTNATITVNASGPGLLNAWVDFDGNGNWGDAGEKIFNDLAVIAGDNILNFAVPALAEVGTSFARFRLSNDSGLSFTGLASDGEVEDYAIEIVDCNISISDVMIVHETCDGADDGTLTITAACASCTNGSADIRYSIDGLNFSNTTGIFTGQADGSYTVSVRDMNNITCTADQIVIINQGSTPTVGGSISSNTVCTPSNTSTLVLTGQTGDVVKWQSSTDNMFTTPMDIVNNTTSLIVTDLSTDTYYRAIVKSGGCIEVPSSTGSILYIAQEVTYNGTCYTNLADALAAVPIGDPATIEVFVNITPPEVNVIPTGVIVQINPGASWLNMMELTNNGQILLIGDGSFTNGSSGLYKGRGTFIGNFINNGTVKPGN